MSEKEFNEVINTQNPVLVSITSRYCDPCFLQKMVIEKVKKNIGKRIFIISIDADDFPDLAKKHNAITRPALLLYDKGELIWEQKDILTTDQVIEIVLEKTF
ncbi:thioredoxin family protein [Flavobacterium sp.]|uniref:thioredoxin family protein n=1 Tax=Flavobacterium sp. TaxID=239 RepID=UPI002609601F|nr:thioredoxin family protein [Flavobacterium sp.]MDG2431978.1 thioredoxin family protein [Flavobacterium sp.]